MCIVLRRRVRIVSRRIILYPPRRRARSVDPIGYFFSRAYRPPRVVLSLVDLLFVRTASNDFARELIDDRRHLLLLCSPRSPSRRLPVRPSPPLVRPTQRNGYENRPIFNRHPFVTDCFIILLYTCARQGRNQGESDGKRRPPKFLRVFK